MTAMDRAEIEKLANLVRLEITSEEVTSLVQEIESILGYVSEVQSIAAEESEPEAGEHRNVVRDDGALHESGMYTEAILDNAPNREQNYIKVKRIIQHE